MDPTTGPVGTEVNREGLGIHTNSAQLLPGLPDDFTLEKIAPKLPWKSLCLLASESSTWLHAMRNLEVYNARVIYGTLESLVILRFPYQFGLYPMRDMLLGVLGTHKVGLYSTRDGFYFELPPLPVCKGGIPADSECLTVDSKIYALGGEQLHFCEVYALDLAGPKRQLKQCATMLKKKDFRCAAFDGKIYAFGKGYGVSGGSDIINLRDSETVYEVYDPNDNTWSLIEPPPSRPEPYAISAVGEEVVVLSSPYARLDLEYMVYHPVKEEWRVVRVLPLNDECIAPLFAAHGELYRMQNGCIFVLDMDRGKWTLKYHYSFAGLGLRDESPIVTNITVVGDELLAVVNNDCGIWILQSEDFGAKNMDIAWHESKLCGTSYRGWCWGQNPGIPIAMYPIEL